MEDGLGGINVAFVGGIPLRYLWFLENKAEELGVFGFGNQRQICKRKKFAFKDVAGVEAKDLKKW